MAPANMDTAFHAGIRYGRIQLIANKLNKHYRKGKVEKSPIMALAKTWVTFTSKFQGSDFVLPPTAAFMMDFQSTLIDLLFDTIDRAPREAFAPSGSDPFVGTDGDVLYAMTRSQSSVRWQPSPSPTAVILDNAANEAAKILSPLNSGGVSPTEMVLSTNEKGQSCATVGRRSSPPSSPVVPTPPILIKNEKNQIVAVLSKK